MEKEAWYRESKKMIKLGGLKPDKEIPETEEMSSTKIKKIK